jgi:hypothetical protein
LTAIVGILAGTLLGAGVCMRFLRQEMAANVGPRLRRIELQLDNLQAEITLDAAVHRAAMADRPGPYPPRG